MYFYLLFTLFSSEQKKQKDTGGPKRPMSAYMLWLNSSRERIKSENPGISITEISKKAGEMWRQLGKEEKEVRQENKERSLLFNFSVHFIIQIAVTYSLYFVILK